MLEGWSRSEWRERKKDGEAHEWNARMYYVIMTCRCIHTGSVQNIDKLSRQDSSRCERRDTCCQRGSYGLGGT
jgi:hypothetical protein